MLRVGCRPDEDLLFLLNSYGLSLRWVAGQDAIPGSYWGEPEAGLIGNTLWVRSDTPIHSVLHEAAHFACMNQGRRENLDTNAGGDYAEENGVCFLQILLAERLDRVGRERMFEDMDSWGYTFRLGAAKRWFEADAEDARDWLRERGLVTADGRASESVRT